MITLTLGGLFRGYKNKPLIYPLALMLNLSVISSACEPMSPTSLTVIESFEELEEILEEALIDQELEGLAVARVDRDQITWSGYYGLAHLEEDRPVDAETRFMIASVSKTVTGVALMTLYDQGQFELDDAINDSLSTPIINPHHPETPITFRMLLNHTSSIIDEGYDELDLYTYNADTPIELSDFLTDYLTPEGLYYDPRLSFAEVKPGARFKYSNIGSALIGVLVEQLSGERFDQYCERVIFNPLGMNHTSWRLEEVELADLAMPYDEDDRPYGHYTFPDYPNGQLFTTLNDLSRFLLMFMGEGSWSDLTIMSSETARLMRRLSAPEVTSEFGLHWFYAEYQGIQYVGHDGSEQGINTMMFYDPEHLAGAILLSNSDQADLDPLFELVMSLD